MYRILAVAFFFVVSRQEEIPRPVVKLMKAYPSKITGFKDNRLIFSDGTTLVYDDGKKKSATELLENPDVEDMFRYAYTKGKWDKNNRNDAGRIRNDAFFRKLYGTTKKKVASKLVTIDWCSKLVGIRLRVTRANGVDKAFRALSAELDAHPEFEVYLQNIGGTFNWRTISGTSRLSAHSFGMTIDLNTSHSNYWQWDCKCKDESKPLSYHNRIPDALVDIFEKHGFIWGGKWQHYDTMHFEYRPELL